jgi:hypothetical protein
MGAYWNVWKRIDGGDFVIHGLEAYGAGTMTNLIHRFCDGYEAGYSCGMDEGAELERYARSAEE